MLMCEKAEAFRGASAHSQFDESDAENSFRERSRKLADEEWNYQEYLWTCRLNWTHLSSGLIQQSCDQSKHALMTFLPLKNTTLLFMCWCTGQNFRASGEVQLVSICNNEDHRGPLLPR